MATSNRSIPKSIVRMSPGGTRTATPSCNWGEMPGHLHHGLEVNRDHRGGGVCLGEGHAPCRRPRGHVQDAKRAVCEARRQLSQHRLCSEIVHVEQSPGQDGKELLSLVGSIHVGDRTPCPHDLRELRPVRGQAFHVRQRVGEISLGIDTRTFQHLDRRRGETVATASAVQKSQTHERVEEHHGRSAVRACGACQLLGGGGRFGDPLHEPQLHRGEERLCGQVSEMRLQGETRLCPGPLQRCRLPLHSFAPVLSTRPASVR